MVDVLLSTSQGPDLTFNVVQVGLFGGAMKSAVDFQAYETIASPYSSMVLQVHE